MVVVGDLVCLLDACWLLEVSSFFLNWLNMDSKNNDGTISVMINPKKLKTTIGSSSRDATSMKIQCSMNPTEQAIVTKMIFLWFALRPLLVSCLYNFPPKTRKHNPTANEITAITTLYVIDRDLVTESSDPVETRPLQGELSPDDATANAMTIAISRQYSSTFTVKENRTMYRTESENVLVRTFEQTTAQTTMTNEKAVK
mmetsp:Transcript_2030/g.2655  ORF Transcript_2030/g.2655 Transcript_2030/m.2655 type:complete len:200 (+) Transcript_2030:22-621(+)